MVPMGVPTGTKMLPGDPSRARPDRDGPGRTRFGGWWDRAPGPPWRSSDDRVAAGVAGGLAEWSGLPPLVVRVALAGVLVGSGFGLVLYVLAAVTLPVADRSTPRVDRPLHVPRGRAAERAVVALLVALGASLVLRAAGIWLGGDLGFPAAVGAAGLSLAWTRTDEERRELWRSRLARLPSDGGWVKPETTDAPRSRQLLRTIVGSALFVAGASWVLQTARPATIAPVLAAVAATAGGFALLAGPWVTGLWRELTEERRQRIRTEERAEVAAQLHDSVLQTLAAIQRHPDTPPPVAQMARRQERSLRVWLFDGEEASPTGSFASRLRAALHEIDDASAAVVEVVVVGDADADARTDAVVAATVEAAANAARHSGAADVSVYAEVGPSVITVFIRDRGVGFDHQSVAADRRGLRDSIRGRMERHGGSAVVISRAGEGTEVTLELAR